MPAVNLFVGRFCFGRIGYCHFFLLGLNLPSRCGQANCLGGEVANHQEHKQPVDFFLHNTVFNIPKLFLLPVPHNHINM